MKKQNVFIVLLVIVMLFTLVSCRSSDDSNSASLGNDSTTEQSMAPVVENTTDKTQLVVGADYEPTNLQYYVNATDSQKIINAAIYDTLFTFDNGEIVPSLATGYEFTGEDDLDLVITLRDDVTFSNGDPLTADDVLFTMQMNLNNMATATRFAAVDIENSYAEDEHTVVLKLFNYDNCLLPYLTGEYGQILNKKYVEEVGEDEAIGQHPIGTGPYVFSEWDVGTSITLVKNETYWGDPSNQNFDSINYMFFSDDNIRALELEQGNLDIALLNTNESIGRISGMGEQGLAVSSVPLTKVGYFCMATIIEDDTFQVVNKRLAIAHALDMDAIVSTIAGETAIAATSLFPSGILGYADHSYEYDPELAKEYLEKAGCPNGFEFTIEVANNQQMNLELAEAMQAYLGQVGITMNIEPMDFGTQFGNMLAGTQLCSILVGTCNGDPSMGLTAFAPGSGACIAENHDEEFVRLLDACRYERDPEIRLDYLAQLQTYMHDMAYAIPVYEAVYSLGYQSYVEGIEGAYIQGELGFYAARLNFSRG